MNDWEKVLTGGFGGLTLLGVVKLIWHALPKAWAWFQGRQKQAVEVRRVVVEETKVKAEVDKTAGDHALAFAHELREQLRDQVTRTDALETKADQLEKKADQLKEQVEAEAEQRKIAWLSVEAAHLRADEADKTRDKALAEMRRLQETNAELERRLQEMTELRTEDQRTIERLQSMIEQNEQRITELQAGLDRFEHSAYTLTPVDQQTGERK